MLSTLREIAINCHLTEVRNKHKKKSKYIEKFVTIDMQRCFVLRCISTHVAHTHTHIHTSHLNMTLLLQEIVKLLKWESEAEHHKRFDAFALFLLSHGRRNEIYGRDERTVSVDRITALFDGKNCPGLINKPKLFFIQACQGGKRPDGASSDDHH